MCVCVCGVGTQIRDGQRVYVASTGDGLIAELEFPSMRPVRSLALFTPREHVNTLAVRPLHASVEAQYML